MGGIVQLGLPMGLIGPSIGLVLSVQLSANAQRIVPDSTLGVEASQVNRGVIRGLESDRISGGALRGQNLFHSFEQFNVGEGLGAYFDNPTGVEAIFSRVTGTEPSDILGTLGVLGTADLYFINPNGILFGPNSSLDVQGSFAATTASAIGFGELGVFSATIPELPSPLLTVDPSAFLFSQTPPGTITNRSTNGLAPGNGSNVLLLGGDVTFDGGILVSTAGLVQVGGLSEAGTVAITDNGQPLSLEWPTRSSRADVTLTNGGGIGAFRGGGLRLWGSTIRLNDGADLVVSTGSAAASRGIQLQATGDIEVFNSDIASRVGTTTTGRGGNIDISAANLTLRNANVEATTQGAGQAGSVNIQVANELMMDRSVILSDPQPGSSGAGGNVTLQTSQLTAANRSLVSASTFADGDAGGVLIQGDRLTFDNDSLVTTQTRGAGRAGDIRVDAQQLRLLNGTQFVGSSFGGSDAGNLFIKADELEISGFGSTLGNSSGLFSVIAANSIGEGGNISIEAGQVRVENGGLIGVATLGQGNAGDIEIRADRVDINTGLIQASTGTLDFFGGSFQGAANGNSGNITIRANQLNLDYGFIRTQVGEGATGNAGTIALDVRQLGLLGGAQISNATYGNGNAGNLTVQANQVNLSGAFENGGSGLYALVETTGNGRGGNIAIAADQIRIDDQAVVSASTFGNGSAGTLTIQANRLTLDDGSITASVGREALGNGGNIQIDATQLQMQNDATIAASTRGRGSAGNVAIRSTTIDLDAANIGSQVQDAVNTNGNGGNIAIAAQQIDLRNGTQIDTSTFANGNAGTINIQGQQLDMQSDSLISASTNGNGRGGNILLDVDRVSVRDSAVISSVEPSAVNQRGGDIVIRADELQLSDQSLIAAQILGSGTGGEIVIDADRMAFDYGFVSTAVVENASGRGGNITLRGRQLRLRGGAQISPSVFGNGNAGNLLVQVDQIDIAGRSTDGDSSFSSNVEENGNGRAGTIQVESDRLRLAGTANISASVEGIGEAGDITIRANQILLDLGFIRSQVRQQASEGIAGDIAINTGRLNLRNGGQISTGSFTQGDAGNITIQADRINIIGENPANGQPSGVFSILETDGRGRSGNIEIATQQLQIRDGTITASTRGIGDAGTVLINADRIQLMGGLISSLVDQGAVGDGNTVTVRANQLSLRNGGQIATTTAGDGNAGRLFVAARRIDLTGTRRVQVESGARGFSPSGFASSVQPSGVGEGGTLRVETDQLRMRNGARITAEAEGVGNAGNVVVVAQNSTVLRGINRFGLPSEIASSNSIGSQGRGGTITLRTGTLQIAEGAVVNARTANADRGGNVVVQADRLEAVNGGQILTTTLQDGRAGNITLNVGDRIILSGQDATFSQRQPEDGAAFLPNEGQGESGFFASSRTNSTGNGGTIILNTTNLELSDRAQISAQSQGAGRAGGIRIQVAEQFSLTNRAQVSTQSQSNRAGDVDIAVGNLSATNSDITTSAASSSGGSIRVQANQIQLVDDSDIRTDSQTEGGNITLSSNAILAFDDSDIFASSTQRGGDINLNTPAFFGEQYQADQTEANLAELEGNSRVDLNASGQVSSGEIRIPDTNFIQNSLADLPDAAIDVDTVVANSCVVRTEGGGTFLVTGRGGVPERPDEMGRVSYQTGEVRSLPSPVSSSPSWQPGDAILEPQQVVQLADGRRVMSRDCE